MPEAEAWVMIPKVKNKGTECEIDMRPMVLCKDCKHRLECDYWIENGDDWYCADGERKEGR
jgi:hypothetical protein